jgi:hypothetical protein
MKARAIGRLIFAAAFPLLAPVSSRAASLGYCEDNVCNQAGVHCDDTCYWRGQYRTSECSGINGGCIRCGLVAANSVMVGRNSQLGTWGVVQYETVEADLYYRCTDGTNQFIQHQCKHSAVGICVANCQNWGKSSCK